MYALRKREHFLLYILSPKSTICDPLSLLQLAHSYLAFEVTCIQGQIIYCILIIIDRSRGWQNSIHVKLCTSLMNIKLLYTLALNDYILARIDHA